MVAGFSVLVFLMLAMKAGMAGVPPDARLAFKTAFDYASNKTQLKRSVIAAWIGMSEQQLGQWLAVEENQQQGTPNPTRLWPMKDYEDGRKWLGYFHARYAREMGLFQFAAEEVDDVRDQMLAIVNQVQAAMVPKPRMAKATLRTAEAKGQIA